MKIEEDIKLDFSDVLLRPKRSTLSSRSDVSVEREFKFKHSGKSWTGVPIISSNMDTVSSIDMFKALSKNKILTFGKKFNIDKSLRFESYEDLINCKEVDIVYIALPNSFHFYWIKECIKNNKNTLVEKPATLNFTEAKSVKKILSNKSIFFGEAFMYRYHPQINYIIELIKNDKIGTLLSMESSFGENILTKKKFIFFEKKKKIKENDRRFDKNLGGGCILDLGCYTTSFSLLINSIINKTDISDFNISNTNIMRIYHMNLLINKINTLPIN